MRYPKSLKINFISFLFIALLSSCNSSDDSNNPTNTIPDSIVLNAQNSYTGLANQVFQLTTTVKNSDGETLEDQPVIWSSSDTSIATITNEGILKIITEGQVNITVAIDDLSDFSTINIAFLPPNLIAFTVSELSNQLVTQGLSSLTFLDDISMSSTYLEVDFGDTTTTTTSSQDQVYYFYNGNGNMLINGETVLASEQSAIYIKRGLERSISMVNTDMQVLILESKSTATSSNLPYIITTYENMEGPRETDQNIWNPFLEENTMTLGLYMLPESVGGNSTITQPWDELNIITSGSGKFQTDHGDVNYTAGSIIFVREGNPHTFNELTGDTDGLNFWSF